MMKFKRRRSISALELRCLAGCAPERRGSALLIVIGTLALVAVFAAVYISIGRTDRRAANALRTRIEQRDTSIQVADNFAGVIGDDRLDAYVQYDSNGTPFAKREVTDAPYTDWSRRSEVAPGNEHQLFTNTGRPYRTTGLTPATDYRVANDPWLASTTPTYLGNPGDPSLISGGTDDRPFSSYEAFDTDYPNSKNFLDQRDWLQISNFAEDGRFVNLFNLRPNASPVGTSTVAQNTVGGFDAEPGFGNSPRADGRPIRRMSNYLSLLNVAEQGNPNTLLRAFDPGAANEVWVPGFNDPQPVGISGLDLYNTPAVWTMYQRFMLMPMNQPFVILNRDGRESTWADPDYPPYQYADADGDGFADSRWIELVAARDATSGGSNANRDDIQQLLDQGDYRYFIAARAVDLSSMVNVNTATDQLVPPTVEYPLGLTPADVDLRRLLTLQDPAGDYTSMLSTGFGIPLSFQAIPRPYTAQADLAYPRSWVAPDRPGDFSRTVTDYNYYQATARDSGGDMRTLDPDSPAMLIGRFAYDALRRAITQGSSLNNDYTGFNNLIPTERTDLVQYEVNPLDVTAPVPAQISQEQRYEQYMRVGRLDPTNKSLSWANTDSANAYGSGLYGLDDLAELLTYHGINDPDFTSRLEQVVGGRYESELGDSLQTRRMSPLLSNRDLTLDRFSHSRILGAPDLRFAPSPEYLSDPSRIGEISRNSMALMALTPRKKMTTMNGFVAFSPDKRISDPTTAAPYDASEPMPLDGNDVVPSLSSAVSNANQLFGIYAGALAGEIEDMRAFAWENDISLHDTFGYSTLFYGHRGPELALRIAAHAAVNMKDLADGDNTPTVATLMVDENRRNDLINTGNFPDDLDDAQPGNQWYRDYPGRAAGLLFDPGENLIGNNELDVHRQAVNVYGMEAMPVITEVSTFYMYSDVSEDAGGDNDDYWDERPIRRTNGLVGPIPDPDDLVPITINGDDDIIGNSDLLMKCIAFQLHNPWDVSISLGGEGRSARDPLTRLRDPNDENIIDASTDQFEFGYYIEYNGYFFKLAEFERYYAPDINQLDTRSIDQNLTGAPNPSSGIGVNGGYLDPATYPDFVARNVVLAPGETRTFYAIADPRFDGALDNGFNEMSIEKKWRAALDAYGQLAPAYQIGGPDADMDGLVDGADGNGWTGPAQEWVIQQFLPRSAFFDANDRFGQPVMIHPMNPQTGEYLDGNVPYDYFRTPLDHTDPALNLDQLDGASGRQTNGEARLWRKITTPAEEENDTRYNNRITQNLLHNDLLVDRLVVDGVAEPLDPGTQDIENTTGLPEDYPDPGVPAEVNARARNDNTGYSILRWHTTTTRDSADLIYDGANFEPFDEEVGQVREWLMKSRRMASDAIINEMDEYTTPLSIEDFRVVSGAGVGDDLFADYNSPAQSDFEVHLTLGDMFQADPVIVTAALPPFRKTETRINQVAVAGGSGYADKFGRDSDAGRWIHPRGGISAIGLHEGDTVSSMPASVPTVLTPDNMRPQIVFNNSSLANAQRLADLLLPWGIGPTHTPDDSLADNLASYYPDEWMTFTEALAIALGYEDPDPAVDSASNIWAGTWNDAANISERVLDDGHLALDRFVPFVNTDPSESPIEFDVLEVTGIQDILRGAGVPMALGVVDRARAIERLDRVTDPINPNGEQMAELELTRATFGTININTAPVEVLRLLPGLTPSRARYVDQTNTLQPEWWGANYPDTDVPDTTNAVGIAGLIQNPDVAAAIVSYRDRMYGFPNTASRAESAGAGVQAEIPLFMSPETANLNKVTQNMIGEVPSMSPPARGVTLDRGTFTGIDAVRSTPGFGSLGELLSVRVNPEFASDSYRWGLLRHLSIDQLGYDERAQGIDTGPDGEITILSQIFGGDIVGETVDDYAEKLAMANSVLNMISVRSDYYAVWFVLQGYKESDVANIRPEDPLIPSIRKRYVMVVDRSNVVEPGDRPRIVMLKEIPL